MGQIRVGLTENPTHKKNVVGLNLTPQPKPVGFWVGFGCSSGFLNVFLSGGFRVSIGFFRVSCSFRGVFRFLSGVFWVLGAPAAEKRNPHLNPVMCGSGLGSTRGCKNEPEPAPVGYKTRR
jgi:hypothetical protein